MAEQQNWKEDYGHLQQEATLVRRMTDASIDCMIALDGDDKVVAWNAACEQFSGIGRQQIINQRIDAAFPAWTENTALTNALAQVKAGHKVFLPAEENAWLKGYFEVHLVPMKDTPERGAVTGTLLVAHDVAHRVKAEQRLKELNAELNNKFAELERANNELATFTNITSNNLKEPLRKIYSFIEKVVMEEGAKLSNSGRANLRKIQSTVQRLGLLADSLISYSDQQPADSGEAIELDKVMPEVVSMLRQQIRETNTVLEIEALPVVTGVRQQVRMLFFQLLSEAIRQSPEGGALRMKIAWAQTQDAPGLCCIILENYSSTALTAGDAEKGNEMAFVRKIVRELGGSISTDAGTVKICLRKAEIAATS